MKKIIIISASVAVALLIAFAAFMFWPAEISRERASEIAVEHVGGGMHGTPEREFEGFRRVWSVEVFNEGRTYEVFVNMNTGEVIGTEVDSWD